MSQTIELFPTPPAQPALSRRTLLALLVAAALHVILLVLPVSLHLDRPPRQAPIHITIAQPPKPAEAPVTEAPIETPPLEDEPPAEEAETIDIPPPSDTAKENPESTPPATSTAGATEQPEKPIAPEDGAKSRSTVFDPGLAKKLARERNKVRKFKSEDAEYRTTTGTFVQRGDRCWEVKQLISGDTSSESSQWLRTKCPKTSRSKSDIDRLARKYGIP